MERAIVYVDAGVDQYGNDATIANYRNPRECERCGHVTKFERTTIHLEGGTKLYFCQSCTERVYS